MTAMRVQPATLVANAGSHVDQKRYQEIIKDKDDLIDTLNVQISCLHAMIDEKNGQIKNYVTDLKDEQCLLHIFSKKAKNITRKSLQMTSTSMNSVKQSTLKQSTLRQK